MTRWRLVATAGLLASAGCGSVYNEARILEYEYKYHQVGNQQATVLELEEILQREIAHSRLLQERIDWLVEQHRVLLEESQARQANLSTVRKERDTLDRSLASVQEEKNVLSGKLDTTKGEVETLKKDVDSATAENVALAKQKDTLQKRRDELNSLIAEVRKALDGNVAALSSLSEKIDQALDPASKAAVPNEPQPTKKEAPKDDGSKEEGSKGSDPNDGTKEKASADPEGDGQVSGEDGANGQE